MCDTSSDAEAVQPRLGEIESADSVILPATEVESGESKEVEAHEECEEISPDSFYSDPLKPAFPPDLPNDGNGPGRTNLDTDGQETLSDTCPSCEAKLDRIVFDRLDGENKRVRRVVLYSPCNCGNYYRGGVARDTVKV